MDPDGKLAILSHNCADAIAEPSLARFLCWKSIQRGAGLGYVSAFSARASHQGDVS